MRKSIILLLGLFLMVGIMMVPVSSIIAKSEKENVSSESEVEELTGEIVSISLESLSLVLRYIGDEELQILRTTSVYCNDTTEIKKGENTINFSDLKAGDNVAIRFAREDGWKKVAKTVIVKSETESSETESEE